jgi:hypothetical protein
VLQVRPSSNSSQDTLCHGTLLLLQLPLPKLLLLLLVLQLFCTD